MASGRPVVSGPLVVSTLPHIPGTWPGAPEGRGEGRAPSPRAQQEAVVVRPLAAGHGSPGSGGLPVPALDPVNSDHAALADLGQRCRELVGELNLPKETSCPRGGPSATVFRELMRDARYGPRPDGWATRIKCAVPLIHPCCREA
jgi:hypothetical protein